MRRHRLGRTGLDVSAFTFGCGYVGGILIHAPEEVRLAALERALAAGCNWLDTAADYGSGESERTLGRLLPRLDPRPFVSTKLRLDVAAMGDMKGQIRHGLEASLERLKLDSVTLYQLHNRIGSSRSNHAVTAADVLAPGGIADVMHGPKEEGLVDHIGITCLGEIGPILEVVESGRFDTAQVYYNMLNPSAGRDAPPAWGGQDLSGLLDACADQDMGVMNIRVLAGGALASPVRHGREVVCTDDAALDREAERAERLFAILGEAHGTRAQTAIRFALAEERIGTIVVGLASLEHLDEALGAVEAGPLPRSALQVIERVHAEG